MSQVKHPYWEGIWHPYKSMESHYNEKRYNLLSEGKLKVWNSFDIVKLDEDINWDMDPFDNKTWGLYFNSLNWLYSLYWGYDNGKEDFVNMHDIVVGYCNYLDSGEVNEMAWFDHSTSDRLCFLATLLLHPIYKNFPEDSKKLVTKIIFQHISHIREFYDSKFWFNSNHGVFHALAILNIAQLAPFSISDYGLEPFGTLYLEVSLQGILSLEDNFTLEQSVYYHQLALSLLETIPSTMLGRTSFGADLINLIPEMIETNYWVTLDDLQMVPLGDTAYGANIPKEYIPKNHPFEKLKTFSQCGFSIYKSKNMQDTYDYLSFQHQNQRGPHGHFDALSITISHQNIPFLVDSGGPYKYGDPFRFTYFMSNRAHNNLIVNNNVHQSGATDFKSSIPFEDVYCISASHLGYDPIKVSRELFIFEQRGVLVVDRIDSLNRSVDLKTIWHFAKDSSVEQGEESLMIENYGSSIRLFSSHFNELNHSIVSGVEGDSPQGWLTDGIGKRVPIPTLISSITSERDTSIGWFFSFEKENTIQFTDTQFTLITKDKRFNVSFGNGLSESVVKID